MESKLFIIGYIIMTISLIPGTIAIRKNKYLQSAYWLLLCAIGVFLMGFFIHLIWAGMVGIGIGIPLVLFWFYYNEFGQKKDKEAERWRIKNKESIKRAIKYVKEHKRLPKAE